MKAVTVRQPWASLIAAGVKTIETRPRATGYRGRIAVDAAVNLRMFWQVWEKGHRYTYGDEAAIVQALMPLELDPMLGDDILPRGAVVASAVLTDCVPIVERDTWEGVSTSGPRVIRISQAPATLWLNRDDGQVGDLITDQLPFGDFSPGRWALLLDDIKPTTERCPWCWGVMDIRPLDPPDTSGRPYMQTERVACPVCDDKGVCDPVPASGQQAVPWEWTP